MLSLAPIRFGMAPKKRPSSAAPERRTKSKVAGGSAKTASLSDNPANNVAKIVIPSDRNDATLHFGARSVGLTNLRKLFFPEIGATKGDLLRYYAAVAPYLLPHIRDRAMVMKRYPNGATGDFFFMKRTPPGAPEWLRTCR